MPGALAASRRERKKQATRRAIHVAAFELAEARGLAGVTVEAIAEQADVAPRTFWAYFASKEDAVLGIDPDRPRALREALRRRPDDEDPLAALEAVVGGDVLERAADSDRARRRISLVRAEPALRAAMAAAFDAIERALVVAVAERAGLDAQRDLYPTLAVGAVCSACRAAQLVWNDQLGQPRLDALLGEAFERVASGLGRPPAPTPDPTPVPTVGPGSTAGDPPTTATPTTATPTTASRLTRRNR